MSLNVLVVDDSEVMRAMVTRTLRLSGIPLGEVHQAENGEQGLATLAMNWIDLLLLDINMPVMDGEEMMERVRATPGTADLAVVVISTESSDARIQRMGELGAAFVHKPFTPEALRATIVKTLDLRDDELSRDPARATDGLDF